jgi:hypothetical protein
VKDAFHRRGFVLTITTLWLAVVGTGTAALWKYSMTPGEPAAAPLAWPETTSLETVEGLHTLVMFAHPKCSCSRASLGELAKVMTRLDGRVRAYVLFMKPSDFEADWEKTDLWQRAVEIPDVTAIVDEDGREAAAFGARTSGQIVAYDAAGHLLFAGGITSGRAHEGDNIGESRLIALIEGDDADANHAAVYGCGMNE